MELYQFLCPKLHRAGPRLQRATPWLRWAKAMLCQPQLRLRRVAPVLCQANPELRQATLMLYRPSLRLHRAKPVRDCQRRCKSAGAGIESTIDSLAANTSLHWADDVLAGHHVGYHPADATSPVGCVGGTLGDLASPLRCLQSDSGNVTSALVDVTSVHHYIGCLDQCNIGSKCLM
jgi:hypothetical protein